MGIAIVRFENSDGQASFGRLEGKTIRPIPGPADSLAHFIRERTWEQNPAHFFVDLEEVKLLSPVTAPCQVICQGKNYRDHMLETGMKAKDHNILFAKADSALAPPRGEIRRPPGVRLLDYEIELGLVIGAGIDKATEVTEQNLHEFVAGIVMANDLSARDVQVPQRQWFKGKSFRGFCPVGPVLHLLDPEEFPLLHNLELRLSVNGEERQRANTKQMIYKPADTLAEVSRIFDLRPGDLLLTGTPGGVAMRVKPKSWWQEVLTVNQSDAEKFTLFVEGQELSPRYLQNGDTVESSIRSPNGAIDLGRQNLVVQS